MNGVLELFVGDLIGRALLAVAALGKVSVRDVLRQLLNLLARGAPLLPHHLRGWVSLTQRELMSRAEHDPRLCGLMDDPNDAVCVSVGSKGLEHVLEPIGNSLQIGSVLV